jgi:formylmethanofuran--tetrahydromethanopterin N-formyltransferase
MRKPGEEVTFTEVQVTMVLFRNNFYVGGLEVNADAYAEAFPGRFTRLIITADDEKTVRYAAEGTTSLPSTVVGRPEGGVERYLGAEETPDGRPGALIQLWMSADTSRERFEREISLRLRQGTLVELETAVFNADTDPDVWQTHTYDTMETVGYCGDGYQEVVERYGRKMICIPLMSGEFLIERIVGVGLGVTGGNVWFFCDNKECLGELRERTLAAVHKVPGVIAPFRICSAGSKPVYPGQAHPEIGPTTNHPYCPSLRGKIPDSMVPEGIVRIPEIVIDGVNINAVKEAMKKVIVAADGIDGVVGISAGNYEGKLGKYSIYLRDIFA